MPSSGKPAYFLRTVIPEAIALYKDNKSLIQPRITIAIMRKHLDKIIHLSALENGYHTGRMGYLFLSIH